MPLMGRSVRGRAPRSSHASYARGRRYFDRPCPSHPSCIESGHCVSDPRHNPVRSVPQAQARVTRRSPLSCAHSTSNEVSAVFLSFGERRWRGSWVALRTQVGAIVAIGALPPPGALVAVPAPERPLQSRRWWCEAGQVGESGQCGGAGLVGCLDSDKPAGGSLLGATRGAGGSAGSVRVPWGSRSDDPGPTREVRRGGRRYRPKGHLQVLLLAHSPTRARAPVPVRRRTVLGMVL